MSEVPEWLLLTDDQRQLAPTLAKVLQFGEPHRWTTDRRESDLAQALRKAADLGLFALSVPENQGGGSWSGSPVLDIALAAGVLGNDLSPICVPDLAAAAVLLAGSKVWDGRDEMLASVAAGERLALSPFQVKDPEGRHNWPRLIDGLVSGGRLAFHDLPGNGILVVPVRQGSEWLLWCPDLHEVRVDAIELESLDVTRRVLSLDLDARPVPDSELLPVSRSTVRRAISLATALVCIEMTVAIESLLAQAVEYSRTRQAFGSSIGSFQAIKHLLAQARVEVEAAKAVSLAAVEAAAEGAPYAREVASIAKLHLDDRAVPVSMECLQVFGGIGFSWEHELHLWMRRVAARAASFGTREDHLALLDDLHLADWEVA